jgi:hypothetical protein
MLRKTFVPILAFLLVISLRLTVCAKSEFARGAQDRPSSQNQLTTNSWRGLVPLRSTRGEVETRLGKPIFSLGSRYRYENENEKVDVIYSPDSCELIGTERWNVPKDVVIWMEIYPRKRILLKSLRLDPQQYRRFQGWHPENLVRYENEEEGVIVHTIIWRKVEEVNYFQYLPTVKDKDHRCKESE